MPRLYFLIRWLVAALLVFPWGTSGPAAAQTAAAPASASPAAAAPLRVATRVIAPFVIKGDPALRGFSIDLWNAIAREMGASFEFKEYRSLNEMLAAVRRGEADLAIAAISITEQREREFDFSQPMFEAGLQILVPSKPSGFGADGFTAFLFSRAFLELLGVLLLLVVIQAHIIWFAERRREDGIAPMSYPEGVLKAAWWASSTLGGQADEMPRSPLGRVTAVITMFISVLFVASFTAAVTTAMTVQQLKNDITGPGDLVGKRVATIAGSTSAQYLAQNYIEPLSFEAPEEAFKAVEAGRADAMLYDSPVVLYYASHDGRGKVQVVGSIFRTENYGILFPSGSPHRKQINAALLKLRESGAYATVHQKWFEVSPSQN